jgi:hypothetical protein
LARAPCRDAALPPFNPFNRKARVKPQMMSALPTLGGADERVTDISAQAALSHEIATMGNWLAAQGLDVESDGAREHEGTRDRLYWRYGYFVGLKRALALLTGRGATLH